MKLKYSYYDLFSIKTHTCIKIMRGGAPLCIIFSKIECASVHNNSIDSQIQMNACRTSELCRQNLG